MFASKLDAPQLAGELAACTFTDITLPSDTSETRRLQETIIAQLLALGVSEAEAFSIRLALEEALVNAVKHGNQMDRSKKVRVCYRLLTDRFEAQITDEGDGFDPEDVPDPTAVENLERPCGRGLMLMRYYMTRVEYNERGNSVSMVKVYRSGNGAR